MREEIYGGVACCERLGGDRPANELATFDIEHKATPERVAAARALFPEGKIEEFEAVGRKLRHRETGVEYTIAKEQVLMDRDPRRSGVECFVVAGYKDLCYRIANDRIAQQGGFLDRERLGDLVGFLAFHGVRAALRYESERAGS